MVEKYFLLGRRLQDLEAEEERKRDEAIRATEFLTNLVDLCSIGRQNLLNQTFVLAHFSTHFASGGKVVPAEGALLKMSLKHGILMDRHWFLPPGDLPPGIFKNDLKPNFPPF